MHLMDEPLFILSGYPLKNDFYQLFWQPDQIFERVSFPSLFLLLSIFAGKSIFTARDSLTAIWI